MEKQMKHTVVLAGAHAISGLEFRHFQGPEDYPLIVKVFEACREVDELEWSYSVDEVRNEFTHLTNFDPYQDVLFAELKGNAIGWTRVSWRQEHSGDRVYRHRGLLDPEWRRRGIGRALLLHSERRLRAIAASHPSDDRRLFQVWCADTEGGTEALLRSEGYEPARYLQEMSRTLEDDLPSRPLPEGFEVRPVEEAHIRPIWEANEEAFHDHWGTTPRTAQDYEEWRGDRRFDPDLWKVAWDGDEVAGMVLNVIDEDENWEFDRKRGYTEDIAVRRAWRRRGLATGLIAQSLRSLRDLGMKEAALAVDTENLSGALRLYEGLGFERFKLYTVFRKPLDD